MNTPCKKCKEAGEHRSWNHTGEQDKHFFKVMIGDFHERLTIPDRFAQHFRGATGRTIKLESHKGYTVDVQVTWNLEKLVIESGWEEFASAHDLRMGDFLVFNYDGNSQLKVLIFGPSGCEKTSACHLVKNAAPGEESWRNSSDILSTFHDLPMEFPQGGNQTSARWDSSGEGNSIISISSSSSASESAGDISPWEDNHEADHEAHEHDMPSRILTKGTLAAINHVQKKQLEEKVRAIYSGIPIYGCAIGKSNIYGENRILEISRKYAQVYLPFEDQMLTLQRHAKKWSVRCHVKDGKSKRLLRGWKEFAHDNNLQLGDVCLFELLTNKMKYVMNVHVIRKSIRKR
uniref:Uncharacterized protein n=1 Tax=Avena sativa TaxID=4498 RepID=A0ACD5X6A2_AVESA